MWPRDALYISYREDKFNYIAELEAQDEQTFYCDCCDPARQKKRAHSDSSEEDDEDEDDDENEEEDEDDKGSTTSSSETKTELTGSNQPSTSQAVNKATNQPGWFGKGRRKRARC